MKGKAFLPWIVVPLLLLAAGGAFATGGAEGADAEAKLEITLAIWGGAEMFPADKPDGMTQKVEKELNITIKGVPYGWADGVEKSNVWAAANDLPDITCAYPGMAKAAQWAEGGALHVIPDNLDKYPNLKKYLNQPETQYSRFNGKLYAIPRFQFADPSFSYKQIWLIAHKEYYQPLGLSKFPETFAEFRSMLLAMKSKFPKVTPLVFWNTSGPQCLVTNFMPAYDAWVKEGDKYIPGFFAKGTLEAVKAFRTLVADGVIDIDFPTQANDAGRVRWINKEGAVMTASPMPAHWPGNYDQYKDKWGTNIYEHIVWGPMPAGKDDKFYYEPDFNGGSESYIGSKVSDQKFDRILKLYDWLASDKGTDFRRYGVEGVDFVREGSNLKLTRVKLEDGSYKALASIYPSYAAWSWILTWDEGFPFVDPTVNPVLKQLGGDFQTWKKTKSGPVQGYALMLNMLSTPLKDKFAIDKAQDLWKLFLSTGDLQQEWNALVQKYEKAGLNEMIAEVNKVGKEKGYIK